MKGAVSVITVAVQGKNLSGSLLTALLNQSPDGIKIRGGNIAGITFFSLAQADFTSFVSVVAWRMEFVPLVPCHAAAGMGNPAPLKQHASMNTRSCFLMKKLFHVLWSWSTFQIISTIRSLGPLKLPLVYGTAFFCSQLISHLYWHKIGHLPWHFSSRHTWMIWLQIFHLCRRGFPVGLSAYRYPVWMILLLPISRGSGVLSPTAAYQPSLPLPSQPAKEQGMRDMPTFGNIWRFQWFQAHAQR